MVTPTQLLTGEVDGNGPGTYGENETAYGNDASNDGKPDDAAGTDDAAEKLETQTAVNWWQVAKLMNKPASAMAS